MPAFGTCAGMILLATEVVDGRPDQHRFGAIDIAVRRNGFGRQVDSFETDLGLAGLDEPLHAVFIRAPLVEKIGPGVEVLASRDRDGRAVPPGGLPAGYVLVTPSTRSCRATLVFTSCSWTVSVDDRPCLLSQRAF